MLQILISNNHTGPKPSLDLNWYGSILGADVFCHKTREDEATKGKDKL